MTPVNSTEQTIAPVAVQAADKSSIYNHYKTLISLRNSNKALTYGTIEPVKLENRAISAFTRTYEGESVLVLHNLSGSEVSMYLPAELENYKQSIYQHNNAKLVKKALQLPAYSTLILKK